MGLLNCLSEVMDLPVQYASKEAESKLVDTFMFVNDELTYIWAISDAYLGIGEGVHKKELRENDVKSLAVWVPKTGVYFAKKTGEPVFLQRKPLRQWRRSFTPHFYNISFPLGGVGFPIRDVDTESCRDIWVARDKSIYYMLKKVGFVKDSSSIVCNEEFVVDELHDWVKGTRDATS